MGVDLLRSKLQNKKLRSVKTIWSGLSKRREITTNWGTKYMKCCFPKCWSRPFVSHTTQEMTVAAKIQELKNTLFVNSIDQNSVEFVDLVER